MNPNMTISKRISLLAGVLLTLAALMGGLIARQLLAVDAGIRSLTSDAMPGLAYMADVTNLTRSHQSLSWQHIASPAAKERDRIETELERLKAEIGRTMISYEGTISQADDRANFSSLKQSFDGYFAAWEGEVLPVSKRGATTEAARAYLAVAAPLAVPLMESLGKMQRWNSTWGETTAAKAVAASTAAKWWMGGMLAVMLAVGIGFTAFLLRGIQRALGQVTRQIADGAERTGGVARGDVGFERGDQFDGAQERGKFPRGGGAGQRQSTDVYRDQSETGANGGGHGRDPCLFGKDFQDHQGD